MMATYTSGPISRFMTKRIVLKSIMARSIMAKSMMAISVVAALSACAPAPQNQSSTTALTHAQLTQQPLDVQLSLPEQQGWQMQHGKGAGKPVVYQVFTRLFGNTNTNNIPWGTLEQNGVGKFADFTDTALQGIAELGVSHVWYTGVPHHALVNDYTAYGISNDDPDVIKGRAGSPYAIKDYYNVNPDLAVDPAQRLAEFEALIARTHANGMKVIIDIVPNHVARQYEAISRPAGIVNLGDKDDTSVTYAPNNNFYYVQGESFSVPEPRDGYQVLGGKPANLKDGKFSESPAKWTGNGSRAAQPDLNDWYETVKVNYGVRPDGTYDFPRLPQGYEQKGVAEHHAFWQDKTLPDSWYHHIVHYWLEKGVDGFRYDMAEMVPSEFWSFLNSSIKVQYPDAFLLAEVYNPAQFREYLHIGKMDYLYDKVDFYDSLKAVMQGHGDAGNLERIQEQVADIEPHMLHFLENHDEQRIASPDFAGDMHKGKPALVVSALISRSPTMLYFGQEVGEDGSEETGFGDPTRTTIFDYAGVPAHQRWMNAGKFDGGQLSSAEKALREYHVNVLNISANHPAMKGSYISLHDANISQAQYGKLHFAFARYANLGVNEQGEQEHVALLVVNNFDAQQSLQTTLSVPHDVLGKWNIPVANYNMIDLLNNGLGSLRVTSLGAESQVVDARKGTFDVHLAALESAVFELTWFTPTAQ